MRRGQRAREEPSRRDREMSRGQRAAYEGDKRQARRVKELRMGQRWRAAYKRD